MADADDDEKCFGDTLPSFEPCDESFAEQCREKISSDKSLAPFFQNKYITQASVLWDKFYNRNTVNFFKDRHWIMLEFHEIGANSDEPCSLFEVGCGVGNTFFPLLEKFPNLTVYAVDFAPKAIDFIKSQDRFEPNRCHVWVCDVALQPLPVEMPLVDYATMVFVLSAMSHEQMPVAVQKIHDSLKPGGYLFFRDYARYDLTQLRFKSGSKLNDDCYARWDGTLTSFVTREQIESMFEAAGLVVLECLYHRKVITNRKRGVEMRRCWLQCRAYKPHDENERTLLNSAEEKAKRHRAAEEKIRAAEMRLAAAAAAASEAHASNELQSDQSQASTQSEPQQ